MNIPKPPPTTEGADVPNPPPKPPFPERVEEGLLKVPKVLVEGLAEKLPKEGAEDPSADDPKVEVCPKLVPNDGATVLG